jgi:hypothetical protein
MNNNVFLKSNKENVDNNEKHNPDVVRNYSIVKNIHNKGHDGKFVNAYYKSITNEPVKTNIRSVKELQLEKDTPDLRTLTTNYDKSLQQRMAERMIVEQSIQRYKRENGIVEKTHEEINREYKLEQERLEEERQTKEQQIKEQQIKEQQIKEQQINQLDNITIISSNNNVESTNISINNLILDDDEDRNIHANLKNQYKTYVLKDNDKLLKEKKKYNDILKDLEDIL